MTARSIAVRLALLAAAGLPLACAAPAPRPDAAEAGAEEPTLRCAYEAPTGSHLPAWICDADEAAERRRVAARERLQRPGGGARPHLTP